MSENTGAFRAIVWKELRENLNLAILGALFLSAGLYLTLRQQVFMAREIDGFALLINGIFRTTTLLAPLFGFMIGAMQVARENHGDSWGFLIHRPVRRSTLFLGKVVAGLLLYAVSMSLPLALAFAWIATPGHLPMPWDAHIMLPGVADLLCGGVYYFAGLLTVMRNARWHGTRAMGLGLGMLCSTAVIALPEFWQATACCVLGMSIAGAAAWGAFKTGGQYGIQQRITRVATGITIFSGLLLVTAIVVGIIGSFMPNTDDVMRSMGVRSASYRITYDGEIVKQIREYASSKTVEIDDLQGHAIEADKEQDKLGKLDTGVVFATPTPMNPGFSERNHGYRGTDDLGLVLQATNTSPTQIWYYIPRLGLIAEYDKRSAHLDGWLGPDGYTAGNTPPAHRFPTPMLRSAGSIESLIAFSSVVYRMDLGARSIETIFTPTASESILGAQSSYAPDFYGSKNAFDTIATTQRVIVQSRKGVIQISVPHDPRVDSLTGALSIDRATLAQDMPTFVWYSPAGSGQPRFVTKYGAGNAVLQRYVLPDLSQAPPKLWRDLSPLVVLPLAARAALEKNWRGENWHVNLTEGMTHTQWIVSWLLPLFSGLVSALAAFARGREYAFAGRQLFLWSILGFILGPLCYLTMLALVEWPALETCAACGRKRVVTHERCEHCSKPFPPPQSDGTEIFEPIIT